MFYVFVGVMTCNIATIVLSAYCNDTKEGLTHSNLLSITRSTASEGMSRGESLESLVPFLLLVIFPVLRPSLDDFGISIAAKGMLRLQIGAPPRHDSTPGPSSIITPRNPARWARGGGMDEAVPYRGNLPGVVPRNGACDIIAYRRPSEAQSTLLPEAEAIYDAAQIRYPFPTSAGIIRREDPVGEAGVALAEHIHTVE